MDIFLYLPKILSKKHGLTPHKNNKHRNTEKGFKYDVLTGAIHTNFNKKNSLKTFVGLMNIKLLPLFGVAEIDGIREAYKSVFNLWVM